MLLFQVKKILNGRMMILRPLIMKKAQAMVS